ncbi:MAG: D-sedoheptulose 7-phosphate isomerase [Acidobacteriota bacterium]|jgi:D-sedoheptulose 7-phosphate isomerase|nr:D-sedoheptulose 7-phosphate isomerase [Acidobacteriota bacterium]
MTEGLIEGHFEANREVVARSAEVLGEPAMAVARALVEALGAGHKVIAFGNGGSAAQASHLVGELLGRFKMTRQPFPAVALASDSGTVTCITNDFGYEVLFERQVEALTQRGDIAFGFTTSGRSENVKRGLAKARERGAVTVAVTGAAGIVGGEADHVLAVPSDVTAHIQEVHLMLLHVWCIYVDEKLGRTQA